MPTPEPVWEEGIRIPTVATLKKYGLSETKWRMIARRQGYACAICKKKPKTGILHIDHEHVRGWKRMKPRDRRDYVRGLVCQFCNRFVLARTMTLEKARAIVEYLEGYLGQDE